MLRSTRMIVQWSLTAVLAGYVVWFVLSHREVFAQRFAGTMWHGLLLASGICASWIVNSLQTLLPLRELGARVGFAENLLLTVAAGFGNYLPMRAGTVLRMRYIKSMHGIGYLRYGGVLGTRALLLLWVAGAAGLCGSAAMLLARQPVRVEVFLLFLSVLAVGVAPFVLRFESLLPTRGVTGRVASQVVGALELIRGNRRLTACYLGLVLLQFGILTLRLSVAFDVIQQHPAWWVYCFLSPAATVLSFISITPGNLGLREWLIGVLSAGAGVDYTMGLFAAAVDRVVLIAMTFSVGGLAALIVVVRLGRRNADA